MKRSNLLLLILLAISIVAYFIIKNKKGEGNEDLTPTSIQTAYLIQEAETVLQSVRIFDNDYNISEITRGQDGLWMVNLPASGVADQTTMSAIETQLGSLQIITDLGSVANLADFGIQVPNYTIKLTYVNETKHKLEVGNLTPTKNGYYIQLDDGKVSIVSQYSIDSIIKLIENPPYPATPTPQSTTTTP